MVPARIVPTCRDSLVSTRTAYPLITTRLPSALDRAHDVATPLMAPPATLRSRSVAERLFFAGPLMTPSKLWEHPEQCPSARRASFSACGEPRRG